MNPVELILKKRNGYSLSPDDIHAFINSYLDGSVAEYQMSALLMAIYFQGMRTEEIQALTSCYIASGKSIDFPADIITADKHSTGGVGDKISLMLAPIAAALDLYIPMISGRGLGHTGGTLDKLESIPGFRTAYTMPDFTSLVLKHKLAMVGQSAELVPADKRIYALRDVTATVESYGLITASIMSKKIAEGAKHLVIDLKVGSGAFMPSLSHARELAQSLIHTGKAFGQKVTVIFTNMDSPLGMNVGNALEVREAIDYLKGTYLPDTQLITETLVAHMLLSCGKATSFDAAVEDIRRVVSDGSALGKFREMIMAQGGNPAVIDDYSLMGTAKHVLPIHLPVSGYIKAIDCRSIGYALNGIGAGRMKVSDSIDYAAGAVFTRKVGDAIAPDVPIGYVHANNLDQGKDTVQRIINSFAISPTPIPIAPIILDVMTGEYIA